MISEEIKREFFDKHYQYAIEHGNDPDPVLLYPKSYKDHFIEKYNLSEEQIYELMREFTQEYGGGPFYPDPLDILKDQPEHADFILDHINSAKDER